MKKVVFILIICSIFLACSSNDNNLNDNISKNLIGVWIPTTIVVEGETIPYDDHEDCGLDMLRFRQDGQGEYIDTIECEQVLLTFIYSVEDDRLEINAGSIVLEVTVIELTSEALILQSEWDFDDDGDIEVVIENYEKDLMISDE